MDMPIKFSPESLSSTCQHAALATLRGPRCKELFETQVRDAPLLFRGDGQFRGGVILQTPLENAEHLGGRLARGADDENVSEPLAISAIAFRQTCHYLKRVRLSPGLLLGRPAARKVLAYLGVDFSFARCLADLGMVRKCFKPVFAAETTAYIIGRSEKLGEIAKGPPRRHLSRPARRSAARKEFSLCCVGRKAVQPLKCIFHRSVGL